MPSVLRAILCKLKEATYRYQWPSWWSAAQSSPSLTLSSGGCGYFCCLYSACILSIISSSCSISLYGWTWYWYRNNSDIHIQGVGWMERSGRPCNHSSTDSWQKVVHYTIWTISLLVRHFSITKTYYTNYCNHCIQAYLVIPWLKWLDVGFSL